MRNKWLISNININPELMKFYYTDSFSLFVSDESIVSRYDSTDEIAILIDGYILPRYDNFEKYKLYSQPELVLYLYEKYGNDLVKFIKGSFNIVIIHKNEFLVFNDYHAIKKYFYYNKNNEFIITNNFDFLSSLKSIEINKLSGAIFALFQHFINGQTILEDVLFSQPATTITYSNKINISNYWNRKELLNQNGCKYSKEDLTQFFKTNTKNIIEYFNPQNIHLTQTGGRDTRTILSSLLANKVKPNLFTFGFPTGRDVIVSKDIAKKLGLEFNNPYIEKPNDETYQKLVNEIVSFTNPLIHLHRAHRLDAIKKQVDKYGQIDILFMGAMGGDYIKGVSFNDYIVSKFIRRFIFEEIDKRELIEQTLNENFLRYDDRIIEELFLLVNQIEFMNAETFKQKEFLIAFDLIGSVHDIQDISIFDNYVDKVICPFMDIDFLEILFNSPFSLLDHNRNSKNLIKKLEGGELQSTIIKNLYPKLAEIEFANGYTANDVLGNNILYFLKRVYLRLFKLKSSSTFSYDNWFYSFVEKNIDNLTNTIDAQYDIDKVLKEFQNIQHLTTEGYWQKFTNPINLSLYSKKWVD